jgi:hypothetical protein
MQYMVATEDKWCPQRDRGCAQYIKDPTLRIHTRSCDIHGTQQSGRTFSACFSNDCASVLAAPSYDNSHKHLVW